ncbi:MAG: hypothetical protein VYC34_02700, partial [Planctomycetota bacterium]|nr:hypothetical protein [Planctomycetota bacterium]
MTMLEEPADHAAEERKPQRHSDEKDAEKEEVGPPGVIDQRGERVGLATEQRERDGDGAVDRAEHRVVLPEKEQQEGAG